MYPRLFFVLIEVLTTMNSVVSAIFGFLMIFTIENLFLWANLVALKTTFLPFYIYFFYYDYLYSRFTYLYFVISLNFLDNFFLAHNHSCLFFTHSTKYYFSSLLKIFMNRSLLSRSVYMSLSSCNDIDVSMFYFTLDIITKGETLMVYLVLLLNIFFRLDFF